MTSLNAYRLEDGECTYVIAETEAEALDIAAKHFEDGVNGAEYQEANHTLVTQLAADEVFGVKEECAVESKGDDEPEDDPGYKLVTRTAAEWCALEGKRVVCSSCFG